MPNERERTENEMAALDFVITMIMSWIREDIKEGHIENIDDSRYSSVINRLENERRWAGDRMLRILSQEKFGKRN